MRIIGEKKSRECVGLSYQRKRGEGGERVNWVQFIMKENKQVVKTETWDVELSYNVNEREYERELASLDEKSNQEREIERVCFGEVLGFGESGRERWFGL